MGLVLCKRHLITPLIRPDGPAMPAGRMSAHPARVDATALSLHLYGAFPEPGDVGDLDAARVLRVFRVLYLGYVARGLDRHVREPARAGDRGAAAIRAGDHDPVAGMGGELCPVEPRAEYPYVRLAGRRHVVGLVEALLDHVRRDPDPLCCPGCADEPDVRQVPD